MKELTGKTIEQILLNDDNTEMAFKCKDGGIIAYEAYGDCCSHSWFSNISGPIPTEISPLVVNEVIERDEDSTRFDGVSLSIQVYGFVLKTDSYGGDTYIEFRNSSNGYYGGYARLSDQSPDMSKFRVITDEF